MKKGFDILWNMIGSIYIPPLFIAWKQYWRYEEYAYGKVQTHYIIIIDIIDLISMWHISSEIIDSMP